MKNKELNKEERDKEQLPIGREKKCIKRASKIVLFVPEKNED